MPGTKLSNQFKTVLNKLDSVLYLFSASYPKKDWDYTTIVFDHFHELISTLESQSPADKEKARELVDMLMYWVGKNAKRAHIVFVGETMLGEERLRSHKYLQREIIRSYYIDDLSDTESVKYIQNFLHTKDEETVDVVSKIGGRISDLESFVSRALSGQKVPDCLNELITSTDITLRKNGFGGNLIKDNKTPWTQVELWKTVKMITAASDNKVPYDAVLFRVFNGNNEAIGITRDKNGKLYLNAASKLNLSVFNQLVNSSELRRGLDIMEKKYDINRDRTEYLDLEKELDTINYNNVGKGPLDERKKLIEGRLIQLNVRLLQRETELREIEKK